VRIVRADKGVFDHKLIEWMEDRRARFVIVARLTPPIKRKLAHLRYVSPSRGVEVAEFRSQPTRWPKPSRFMVIRRPQPGEPTSQLRRSDNRPRLLLPASGPREAVWKYALRQIPRLKP
jgi:hypothetical protein